MMIAQKKSNEWIQCLQTVQKMEINWMDVVNNETVTDEYMNAV